MGTAVWCETPHISRGVKILHAFIDTLSIAQFRGPVKNVPKCFFEDVHVKDVSSPLLYLQKDQIHESEKPYKLQYNPGGGLPHQNTAQESRGPILIQDLRGQSRSFSFE